MRPKRYYKFIEEVANTQKSWTTYELFEKLRNTPPTIEGKEYNHRKRKDLPRISQIPYLLKRFGFQRAGRTSGGYIIYERPDNGGEIDE